MPGSKSVNVFLKDFPTEKLSSFIGKGIVAGSSGINSLESEHKKPKTLTLPPILPLIIPSTTAPFLEGIGSLKVPSIDVHCGLSSSLHETKHRQDNDTKRKNI